MDGKIVTLHKEIELSIQDGVYLGYINAKYGYGMVIWRFLFNEARYEPHRYEISIYRWQDEEFRFVHQNTFTTVKRFKEGCRALRYYGLKCNNYRDEVIRPDEEISTLGIEGKIPQKKGFQEQFDREKRACK